VFSKKERSGDVIVGLFNTGARSRVLSVAPGKLGLPGGRSYRLANLWTGGTSVAGKISATVPSHGVALFRVTVR
jgi:alpha-galactosidase